MNDIAFILLGPIIIGTAIGIYLDKALTMKIPIFTMSFALMSIIFGMYTVFKRYSK